MDIKVIVIIMDRNILSCVGGIDMALPLNVRLLDFFGICYIYFTIGAFHFTHNSLIKYWKSDF